MEPQETLSMDGVNSIRCANVVAKPHISTETKKPVEQKEEMVESVLKQKQKLKLNFDLSK